MPALRDLTGLRFGRWTALYRSGKKGSKVTWRCRCDCGREADVIAITLTTGRSRSCGCLQIEVVTRHGGYTRPEYPCWQSMKDRCLNPNMPHFDRYGGRGITVCERWRDSFAAFLADLGPRPGPGYTLERIDNDGNYEPGNVRWATRAEQGLNRSSCRYLVHEGRSMTVAEWAREIGIPGPTLRSRVRKGWSDERALTTPVIAERRRDSHGHYSEE